MPLHLDVIGTIYRTVPITMRQIFYEFLEFWDLFHELLDELNKGKI